MGDPKFPRRKYDSPSHPWRADRIKDERELVKRYGLKNKRELWKVQSELRSLRQQSRDLQARLRTGDRQAEIETEQLLGKCGRLGLLPTEGSTLNDVLLLNVENILARRFQTMVFQKGFAYTPSQARQFIVHGHISIGERRVTIPGYVVNRIEENEINFAFSSPIAEELHPMHPKPKDSIELEKEKALVEQAEKEKEQKEETDKKREPPRRKREEKPAEEKPAEEPEREEEKNPEDVNAEPEGSEKPKGDSENKEE